MGLKDDIVNKAKEIEAAEFKVEENHNCAYN